MMQPLGAPDNSERWNEIRACVESGFTTPQFWDIWHPNKEALKARGIRVSRRDDGKWIVKQTGTSGEIEEAKPGGLTAAEWATAANQQWGYDALASALDYFHAPLPRDRQLRNYQVQGVAAMIRRLIPPPASVGVPGPRTQGGVYLGDEMGLGKTIQTIALINWLTEAHPDEAYPILILCPKSIRFVWRMEWIKWSTTRKIMSVIGPGSSPSTISHAKVVVCNYDKLSLEKSRMRRAIIERMWGTLVCDECQALKNPVAMRTKGAKAIQANYKVFLSGTPMPNRPVELKSQLDMLAPDEWGSTAAFERRYPAREKDEDRLMELRHRMKSTVLIRRLKTDHDIAEELPDKQRQLIMCEPTVAALDAIKRAEAKLLEKGWTMDDLVAQVTQQINQGQAKKDDLLRKQVDQLETPTFFGEVLATLRRELGESKVPTSLEHIEDFLSATSQKLVVFAHHRNVIESLYNGLADHEPVMLYGGMQDFEREFAVTEFQENPDVKVFVGSLFAASEGITLHAASDVLFVEQDWTPSRMFQAEDRVHRIGQTRSVNVRWLVVDETIDAKIAQTLLDKMETIRLALGVSEY